ncbi:MAG: hypothetical protein AAFX93_15610 [Verrucomicrobiota bacterium]
MSEAKPITEESIRAQIRVLVDYFRQCGDTDLGRFQVLNRFVDSLQGSSVFSQEIYQSNSGNYAGYLLFQPKEWNQCAMSVQCSPTDSSMLRISLTIAEYEEGLQKRTETSYFCKPDECRKVFEKLATQLIAAKGID